MAKLHFKSLGLALAAAVSFASVADEDMSSASRAKEKDWWLPRHEKTVEEIKNGPKDYDLVFVGDSITDFWGNKRSGGGRVAAARFKGWRLLNLGVMGDRIENILWRLENGQGEGYTAKVFMVLAGTNNIGKRADGESVARRTAGLVKWIREKHPESKILLLAILPRADRKAGANAAQRIAAANALTEALADNETVVRLDLTKKFLREDGSLNEELFKDSLHPNAAGYEIWADAIVPIFEKWVPRTAQAADTAQTSTADDIARFERGGPLAADPAEVVVEAPKDMKLVLCMGQSNMAGRARMTDEDKTVVPNAYKLNRDDKWVAAKAPYHFDKSVAAVGPVDGFVKLYLRDHPDETIGVVPCAVGGSPFSSWEPPPKGPRRGANYALALRRAKAAQANGRFIAILWHQGETDAAKAKDTEGLNAAYPEKFAKMMTTLRSELGEGDIPVIAGEIGHWARKDGDHAARINPGINAIPNNLSASAVVSAADLANQDAHHFDREAQRKLAERYYEAFKTLSKEPKNQEE